MRIVNVLYLVIILATSCEINTAQGLWKSGVTPNLERVASINETKNGDLFATSINGIYQSKDLGNSWFRIYKQGSYIKLKVDKNDNMYMLNANRVSSDTGKSWKVMDILFEGKKYRSYLLDVNNDGNLVATIERRNIILYSNSFKDEWRILDELPERINFISFDNNNRIFAFTDNGIFLSDGVESKFRKVHNGFSYVDNKFWGKSIEISGIVFNSKGEIFLTTKNLGVFKGNETATAWVSKNNGLSGKPINCVTINSKGELFIGANGNNCIYKSTDNGENWVVSEIGFHANSADVLYSAKDDVLFVGCYSGIFISTNNGESWYSKKQWKEISSVEKIITDNENVVFVASTKGLYKTNDEGKTWDFLSEVVKDQIYCLSIMDSLIIVGTSNGINYSLDYGSSWIKAKCFSSIKIYSILIVSKDKVMFASEHGVFLSEDLFENCNLINKYLIDGKPKALKSGRSELLNGEEVPILGPCSIKKYEEDIYFCAEQKLFRLNDNNIWEYMFDASSFEILTDGNMFTKYSGYLFIVDVKNRSYNKIETPEGRLRKYFLDIKDRLYVFLDNKKLYISKDLGSNWIDITQNLETDIDITELTITKDDNLIIGTEKSGLFYNKDILIH